MVLFSVLVRQKIAINEKVSFTDYASGIRFPDCSKLAINWKNYNNFTLLQYDIIVKLFWCRFVSVVKFSYWFKFHVSILTGSGVMTIFFSTGLTKTPEIRNTPSEFCPISGDWGELGIRNSAQRSLKKF